MLSEEQEAQVSRCNRTIGLLLTGLTSLPRNEHAHLLDQVDDLINKARQKLSEYGAKSRHPSGSWMRAEASVIFPDPGETHEQ